jgi:hypothetical protein
MPMDHKAFAFDWTGFERDLLPLLTAALKSKDPAALIRYVNEHRSENTDPYEGDPLPEDWQDEFDIDDVHNAGDFALTRFYDPTADAGVGDEWSRLDDELPAEAAAALLGTPIGPSRNRFDPGKYGSYFQRPEQVPESLGALSDVDDPAVRPFRRLLKRCAKSGLGIYVTF